MAEKTEPQVLTTVDSFDGELHERRFIPYSVIRRMRHDPTIALVRILLKAPVLASEWSYEETEEAPKGAKEFIAEQMQPFKLHIQRTALDGTIDFGWQSYEKVFEINEQSQLVIKKIKPLLQDYTEILVDAKTGGFKGLKNEGLSTSREIFLNVEESLLISSDVEGTDWYGQPLMNNAHLAFNSWCDVEIASKRYDQKIAGTHWVIKYPLGTSLFEGKSTDNFEVAQNLLRTLESSGSIVIPRKISEVVDTLNKDTPDAWIVELLADTSNTRSNFLDRQKYLDVLKVRAFGFPERSILEGEFGTKAEAEVHGDFAVMAMEARHEGIVQILNWHCVNQLLRFNYGREAENTVKIVPAPINDLEKVQMQKLYDVILGSPEGFMNELQSLDLQAIRDRIGIPTEEESLREIILPEDDDVILPAE